MTVVFLAKTPPSEVTAPLHELLEYGLWVALLACTIWLIVAAGRIGWAKFNGLPLFDPAGHVLRSLIGAVLASSSLGFALVFNYSMLH
ncbi:hypothetical protein ACWDO0_28315 [Nocardia rhamnosiphila]